ncbi:MULTISPECIES: hypothetical protein [Methylobacterium]|uniref:hypothetical protein n=1 Tax=Methylobacterium TaxID=407 RepID=UPI002F352D1A
MIKTKYFDFHSGTHGEISRHHVEVGWLKSGHIGSKVHYPTVHRTEKSLKFAATISVVQDLKFCQDAFSQAEKLGLPSFGDVTSRSLVTAGMVIYGRCFHHGVREVRLNNNDLINLPKGFNHQLHQYMMDVRDKHIAHSVNSLETCTPIAIAVQEDDGRIVDGFGVGSYIKSGIGMSRAMLLEAIDNLNILISALNERLEGERGTIHSEFQARLAAGEQPPPAPFAKPLDRATVGKARTRQKFGSHD